MAGSGVWAAKNAWGTKPDEKVEEPVVSLVEIMSEELAQELTEEEEKREMNTLTHLGLSESGPAFDNDEEMARALQREFDREYDLSVRLEEQKLNGNKTVSMTPDRYCPRAQQESDDNSSEDDDETREAATELLYAKLDNDRLVGGLGRSETGDLVSKHDATLSGRKNADKALNDTVALSVGDMVSEKISNKVYNSLRSFAKTDAKRQHKLKDKEEQATMETSVDGVTRLALFKWINQGLFDRVEGVIATGKESAVLHGVQGDDDDEHFAIKVYKTSLTEFKNRGEYVKDDFRFKNPRNVLKIWAEREYINLKRMANHNLPCPVPLKLKKHLLLMSLVGEKGLAAPRLRNVDWNIITEDERKEIFEQVQQIMIRMYKECRLVHGDLSEFNLLFSDGKVYVIDVSQAMDLSHPRNLHYLLRDIENVLSFFGRIETPGLPTDVTLFNLITDLEMIEGDNLMVQVEHFSRDNRCVSLRADKQKPANMELRLYNAEKAGTARNASPAREYN